MGILAATLALMAPLAFAGDAGARTLRPVSTFPQMVIRKSETEHEWPFSIDEGELTCVTLGGPKYVFFAEILTLEEIGSFGSMTLPRSVVVTANPMAFLATIEDKALYAPFDSLETLVRRLAPFERMGWELCDRDAAAPPAKEL